MTKFRFTKARKRALAHARGTWQKMSKKARAKTMPRGHGRIRRR